MRPTNLLLYLFIFYYVDFHSFIKQNIFRFLFAACPLTARTLFTFVCVVCSFFFLCFVSFSFSLYIPHLCWKRNENDTIKFINKVKKNYRSNDNLYSLERLQIDGIVCVAQSAVDFVDFFFLDGCVRSNSIWLPLAVLLLLLFVVVVVVKLDESTENIRPNDFSSAS